MAALTASPAPTIPGQDVVLVETIDGAGNEWRGSGVIIGPHTVLTASHVLQNPTDQSEATRVYLYPGYDASTAPTPGSGAWLTGAERWHNFDLALDTSADLAKPDTQTDYAVIDTGATFTNWFGVSSGFSGGTVAVSGYPAYAGGLQTTTTGTVTKDASYDVFDDGSISPSVGESGGPLWIAQGGGDVVVGLVSTQNTSTQLTDADIAQIQAWQAADATLWTDRSGAAQDVNGDGTSDMLLQSAGTLSCDIVENGSLVAASLLATSLGGFTAVGTGDFFGDGSLGILLQDGGTLVAYDIDPATGAVAKGVLLTQAVAGYSVVGTGDFNGDGTTDFLLQSGGTLVDYEMQNGAVVEGKLLATNLAGYRVAASGDFDGDGTTDILLQNGSTLVDYEMDGGAVRQGIALSASAGPFSVVGAGDFNHDGTDDLLLQAGGTLVEYLMTGGDVARGSLVATGLDGYAVAATGDYNGDGYADILLKNGGTLVDYAMGPNGLVGGSVLTTTAAGSPIS